VQPSLASHPTARVAEWVTRTLSSLDAGASLLGGVETPMSVPAGDLPVLPASWWVVDGSRSRNSQERFIAYVTPRGLTVTMHSVGTSSVANASVDNTSVDNASVGNAEMDAPGRLIALVTLGQHRISVIEVGPDRFAARWTVDGRRHCLAVAATTLAAFMPLILDLVW
jgi:hypothetical protein